MKEGTEGTGNHKAAAHSNLVNFRWLVNHGAFFGLDKGMGKTG